MGTLRWAGAATAAILALGAFGTGTAGAHDFSAPSEVEIDRFTSDGAYGHVDSPRAACERNRRVNLYAEFGAEDGLMGSDRTSDNGGWRIELSGLFVVDQQFYARVTRRNTGRGSHDHVCLPDRSPYAGFNEGD